MSIMLPNDILALLPVMKLSASKSGLNEVKAPTGSGTEGMPGAQDLLALFGEFQDTLNSYAELIDYDSGRIRKIVEGFIQSDQ